MCNCTNPYPAVPAETTVDHIAGLRRALGNCYMMACRRVRRTSDPKVREPWLQIIRVCEQAGCRSDLVQWDMPTDMLDG